MRVVSISTDRNIFDIQSPVAKRMIEYGKKCGELHIVIFSLDTLNFSDFQLSPEVFVYPTNSSSKIWYIHDAVSKAKKIISTIYFGETVITAQDPFEAGIAGVMLKRYSGLPLQLQIHTDFYSKSFYDGSLLNWVRFEVSRFTLPKADGVRVVRKKIKDDLIGHFKIPEEKIQVLPVFVDIQKFQDYPIEVNLKMKYPHSDIHVLVASRLSSEKRVDLAIRAFARASVRFPKACLVIVGKGEEEKKLKSLVKRLNLTDKVAFESWQQNVSSYFKTASVFLNTSSFEGYGMTLIEAAAAGCPIITTNVGIAQDMLRDGTNAFVCPVDDEGCLVNKLVNIFENPIVQRSFSTAISEDVKKMILSKEEHLSFYLEGLSYLLSKK